MFGRSGMQSLLSEGLVLHNASKTTSGFIEKHYAPYTVMFICASCIIGAVTRQVMKNWSVPYTVVLIIIGIAFGAISRQIPEVQSYTTLATVDPHLFLTIFLPVILFESAFVMDIHVFSKVIWQVLILAGPGTCVAIGLTGIMAKYIFGYGWSWYQYMLFGSIISATDPVAIVSLLNDLGTTKQLGVLIEGESLFNDGSALVFFHIFYKLSFQFDSLTAVDIGTYFPTVIIGGVVLGYVAGKLTVFWLQNVFNDAMVEITITLSSTYVTYYLGEHVLSVSGVLAVVMLGIEINHRQSSISPELQIFLHRFWEILAYLANTLIFLLVGIAIMEEAFNAFNTIDIFYIIVDYILLFVIRAFIVLLFRPVLKRLGYGLPWQDSIVVIWGGLRGAVGLALALMVTIENRDVGEKILLHTSGIVLLTLLVNATTLLPLLKLLGISEVSDFKKGVMRNAVKRLNYRKMETWRLLKTDRFLVDADWVFAEKACEISNPYTENAIVEDLFVGGKDILDYGVCHKCDTIVTHKPSDKEFAQMMEDGRTAVLKGQKMSFWRQYDRGVLSSEAVNTLVSLTDSCHDTKDRLIEVKDISQHCNVPLYWKIMRKRLEKFKQVHPSEIVPPPQRLFPRFCFFLASHVAFEIILYIAIGLNMVPIVLEFVIELCSQYEGILTTINRVYFFIYFLEACIKITGFRKYYFFDKWNIFDLLILVITTIDVIIDYQFPECNDNSFSASGLKVIKVFRIMRISRVVKLIKGLIPKLINLVDGRINTQISFGYDIGKGFVLSVEEVVRILDQLVLDSKIAADLKLRLDFSHLEVVKSLGLLQRQHPGVAISVKTRQAIRTVLNNSRDTLNELQSNGALDNEEASKLNRAIEVKMKRQLQAPSYIKPKKPEDLLKNLVWLQNLEEDGLLYITSNIEMLSYDYGDVIVKQGELSDGIYVIISGMVKLVGVSSGAASLNKEGMNLKISADYLYAGNVVGEMGLLMDTVRNASVICETIVQAYFISSEKMHKAMQRFKGLHEDIWRVCSIRLAVPLIMANPLYKVYSKEYIRIICERSELENLDDSGIYRITENVREAVLVEGIIMCLHSKETFLGPTLLPKAIEAYKYDSDKKPHILTILNHNTGYLQQNNQDAPRTLAKRHSFTVDTISDLPDSSGYRSTGCQVKHETIMESSKDV